METDRGKKDRLTHAYFGVDLGVVERDIPPLDAAVDSLLGDTGGGHSPAEVG